MCAEVGKIKGDVNTTEFKFEVTGEVKKFDFVSVSLQDEKILAQVDQVTKKPGGETTGKANIIGYREKGLTKAPRRVLEPGSKVSKATQEMISKTLGLHEGTGLQVGNLETSSDLDISVPREELYKHFAVVAQTGAGKSYLSGVLVEEMLESDLPVVVVDPHGEYHTLSNKNPDSRFPESYETKSYSPNTNINSDSLPLTFDSTEIERNDIVKIADSSITNSQMGLLYNASDSASEDDGLEEIIQNVKKEDSTAKWGLLNSLEKINERNIFSKNSTELTNLVQRGKASIVNLKAVEPQTAESTMYLLSKKLFEMRKKDLVPPFIMVIEEAHNFAPEQSFGKAVSTSILRKIASEGRKFGLGIGVISQRPARIDKNVLSQCNTQFILRVTNPNDVKAISKSFEGVTSQVENMIKSLPPGVSFLLGNEHPIMTNIRTRKSEHGGETQTLEGFTEKKKVTRFRPEITKDEYENQVEEKVEIVYKKFLLVDSEQKKRLVDPETGESKVEKPRLTSQEQKIYHETKRDKDQKEIAKSLNLNLQQVNSKINKLRQKNYLKEGCLKPVKDIFEVDISEEIVEKPKIKPVENQSQDLKQKFGAGNIQEVFYPYYTYRQKVFDPVTKEEV